MAPAAIKDAPRRLTPDVRRGQILDAAEGLILSEGQLPLPIPELARRAQASKALIYRYFPTQADLANAILRRLFSGLEAAGLTDATKSRDLQEAAILAADIYGRHVAARGPVAHVLLRDPYLAGALAADVSRQRDRWARALSRTARRELGLPAREAVAALSVMTTIPEEAGRLAHAGEIADESAADLTRQLVGAALAALAAPRPPSPSP
jgi:AcrR family transcriptional regulator